MPTGPVCPSTHGRDRGSSFATGADRVVVQPNWECNEMRPRVLTVGAYERDNLGDLLFLLLTKVYLREAGFDVTAGSILGSTLPGKENIEVLGYADLLRTRTWDAVWVVGGEIGGVRVGDALGMSLAPPEGRVFAKAGDAGKSFVAGALTGLRCDALAYLPDLAEFPLNAATPLVVNSVGISNLEHSADRAVVSTSDRILSSARKVLVRENDSGNYAERHGLHAEVGPDMVHAIADIAGFGADQLPSPRSTPYAIVQINTEILGKYGVGPAAYGLESLSRELDMDVVLLAAGTAPGHDSFAQYARLLSTKHFNLGHRTVEILRQRDPRTLVAYIANATVWAGTSLHGRIISSSFGVPRVTLENDKVARYAATWDSGFPAGVHPESMAEAAESAINRAAEAVERDKSDRLRLRAHANTLALIGALR